MRLTLNLVAILLLTSVVNYAQAQQPTTIEDLFGVPPAQEQEADSGNLAEQPTIEDLFGSPPAPEQPKTADSAMPENNNQILDIDSLIQASNNELLQNTQQEQVDKFNPQAKPDTKPDTADTQAGTQPQNIESAEEKLPPIIEDLLPPPPISSDIFNNPIAPKQELTDAKVPPATDSNTKPSIDMLLEQSKDALITPKTVDKTVREAKPVTNAIPGVDTSVPPLLPNNHATNSRQDSKTTVVTKKKTLPSKKRRNISLTNKNHMPPSRRLRHDASEDIDIASYDRSRIKNQKPSYKYNIDRKKYSSEHSKYGTTLENYKSYSADHTRSTVPSLYNKANNIKYKDNPRRQTENRHHKMLTRDGKPIEHRSRVHNRNSSSPNKDSEALIMAGDSLMFRLKFVPEATKIELAQQLELENIIQTMIDDNSLSVTLYGFADWHRRHGLRFTHEVSHGRVMAVKEYMREKGIRPHRIITEVVGLDLQPGVSRDRVDIVANH